MTDDERFDLFLRRVEELHGTRLVRSGELRSSLNLSAARDQPLSLTTHNPDEDDLRSFLLTFRQFISKSEPIELGKIANLLFRRLTGDEPRTHLANARARYHKELRMGAMAFVLNDERMTPEEVLDLWINGRYFHNDSRKAAAIDALDPMSRVFVRHLFLDVLVEATRYVIFLANVIVIARRDGLLETCRAGGEDAHPARRVERQEAAPPAPGVAGAGGRGRRRAAAVR